MFEDEVDGPPQSIFVVDGDVDQSLLLNQHPRPSRAILPPSSPPKLSQQHHNRDTAIMGRAKPYREIKSAIRLAKQDLLLQGK